MVEESQWNAALQVVNERIRVGLGDVRFYTIQTLGESRTLSARELGTEIMSRSAIGAVYARTFPII